jgi:predicted lipoprotein with Yx(FWY)xxD motif
MKMNKLTLAARVALVLGFLGTALATEAADKKPKPYPLNTCVVSDEKLGADPGMTPYTFVHEGREVRLCCKSCLKDFKKDTAKYVAKIEAAEKKAK